MFIHTSSKYIFSLVAVRGNISRAVVNIKRFHAFMFCVMLCVTTQILQGNSCCSSDISHFVQGIWSILDDFVPLYMTISFGTGLFAACQCSLLSMQFDRIVIIFWNQFRFPSWQLCLVCPSTACMAPTSKLVLHPFPSFRSVWMLVLF